MEQYPWLKQKPKLSYLEGLAKSTLWSPLSLVGMAPPRPLAEWQAENPGSALATQLVGFGGIYGLGAKAARGVPVLGRALLAAEESAISSPILGGAKAEVLRFLPTELARVGIAAAAGDQIAEATGGEFRGVEDVATNALFDLGIAGGFGGTVGLIGAAGKRLAKKHAPPGTTVGAVPQVQLQEIKKGLESGTLSMSPELEATMTSLRRAALRETPKKTARLVGRLEGGGDGRTLNRLLRAKEGKAFDSIAFGKASNGPFFRSREEAEEMAKRAGIWDLAEHVRYPRLLRTRGGQGKRIVSGAIRNTLRNTDSETGFRWARDAEDGTFVLGKQLDEGNWVVFKTDRPDKFMPGAAKFAEMLKERAAVFGDLNKARPLGLGQATEVWDHVMELKSIPVVELRGLDPRKGGTAKAVKKFFEGTGIDKAMDRTGEFRHRAGLWVREYLAPAMHQFPNNPAAARMVYIAKAAKDKAEAIAEQIFLGGRVTAEGKSLYSKIFRGAQPKGGALRDLIRALDEDDLADVTRVWLEGTPLDQVQVGEKAMALLRALDDLDAERVVGLQAVQKAAGVGTPFVPKKGHLGISRLWNGSYRVAIQDGPKVVGYAAGKNAREAHAMADRILEIAKEEGRDLRKGRAFMTGEFEQDLELLKRVSENDLRMFGGFMRKLTLDKRGPARLTKKRKGAEFFMGSEGLTKDLLEELVLKQLKDYEVYKAKLAVVGGLQDDLMRLGLEDFNVAQQVRKRIGMIFGEQGEFSQAIIKATDKMFGPSLGANSASKIASTANKAMFRLTLGFWNLGFNMANLLTFVQTAYPQLAFLASAHPSRIGRYYQFFPTMGGKTVGHLGALDIMKLTKRSFQLLRQPDDDLLRLFDRAAGEGVWDPRFVEEFVGESARQVGRLRDALTGKEPFSKWIAAVADFLPAQTEKFARGHSFVLGYSFFKEVMGIKDPELLYQLSKQFVEKTQFLYSQGDRAQIITGPLGSMFGLFKNWMMHYIGWMAEYTGEATLRGNWKPLAWMVGSTLGVGGIGALPFYGAANAVSKWVSDESIMQHTYELFDPETADVVFHGFPGFLGFTIQNQVAAPSADIGGDASHLFGMVLLDRMNALASGLGAAVDQWNATGESPANSARVRDALVKALAPKVVYRASQAIQGEVLRNLTTGYPVTEWSPAQRFIYGALNLDPTWVANQYRVADELWQDQRRMKERVAAYGKAWAEAQESGDTRTLQQIILKAVTERVSFDKIIASANSRLAKGREDLLERQFSPEALLGWRDTGLVR